MELVHFLIAEIRHPVLFLCVYRPTISPFSTHQTNAMAIPHQELLLRDLSLSEAQNMVESLLKTNALPKDLLRFIRNKVEGNPFYLEEAINSLIESNILVPENGDWKVGGTITESEISATIQGVIAARVDRLEHQSKRILQEASVIGRSFYYDILKKISGINDNIDRSLSGLERFDLIKTKEHSELLIKLIVDWALVYYYRGDFRGLTGLLETHEAIAKSLDDKKLQGMFYAWLGFVLYFRSRYKDSYQYLLKALEIGQDLDDPKITGYACT
jgi:tetratricopeptide (TPR) repeat protein